MQTTLKMQIMWDNIIKTDIKDTVWGLWIGFIWLSVGQVTGFCQQG